MLSSSCTTVCWVMMTGKRYCSRGFPISRYLQQITLTQHKWIKVHIYVYCPFKSIEKTQMFDYKEVNEVQM